MAQRREVSQLRVSEESYYRGFDSHFEQRLHAGEQIFQKDFYNITLKNASLKNNLIRLRVMK